MHAESFCAHVWMHVFLWAFCWEQALTDVGRERAVWRHFGWDNDLNLEVLITADGCDCEQTISREIEAMKLVMKDEDCVKLWKEEQWPLCPVSVMKMIRWKDEKTPKVKHESVQKQAMKTQGSLQESWMKSKTDAERQCGSAWRKSPGFVRGSVQEHVTHRRPLRRSHVTDTETENQWESCESCRTEFTVSECVAFFCAAVNGSSQVERKSDKLKLIVGCADKSLKLTGIPWFVWMMER